MKSRIIAIEVWDKPRPQRDDMPCSAHGRATCARELVAKVVLSDAGSPCIQWNVCRNWLDNEPDVATHRRSG